MKDTTDIRACRLRPRDIADQAERETRGTAKRTERMREIVAAELAKWNGK